MGWDEAAKAALEGGSVVVYYTGEGADVSAARVAHIGQKSFKIAKGSFVRMGGAAKTCAESLRISAALADGW